MAKRKSLNKRLSRYSNRSTVSAILDNDTNDLGEERPLWWRDLDNNTIARSSTNSYLMNETSRNLSSGSQLTSEVQEGWWKDLEQSNISNDAKANAENIKTDGTLHNAISSTSDSDEEPRIRKRKLPLRRGARKSQGNAFLNILNNSKSSIASEQLGQSTRENSVNKLMSTENIQTLSDGHKSNSINHSGNTDIVVKTKPRILLRKLSDKGENAFDNVLNTDIQDSPSKSKSSVSTPKFIKEHSKHNNTTKSPVIYQRRQSRFTLSFENEQDISHFPIPKAQSTILESNVSALCSSGKELNENDSETEVSKRKSRFAKHMHKSVGKNLENILVQAGANSKVHDDATSVSSDISLTASTEGSGKIPTAALENKAIEKAFKVKGNIEEDKSKVEEENHTLGSSRIKNKPVTQRAPRSEKSTESNNLMEDDNDTSENTSGSAPSNSSNVFKQNTQFLRKSRKSLGTNLFQNILEESGSSGETTTNNVNRTHERTLGNRHSSEVESSNILLRLSPSSSANERASSPLMNEHNTDTLAIRPLENDNNMNGVSDKVVMENRETDDRRVIRIPQSKTLPLNASSLQTKDISNSKIDTKPKSKRFTNEIDSMNTSKPTSFTNGKNQLDVSRQPFNKSTQESNAPFLLESEKVSDKSQEESDTSASDHFDVCDTDILQRESKIFGRPKKQWAHLIMVEPNSQETEGVGTRQSDKLRKSRKSIASATDKPDLEVARDDTNRQSKTFSGSRNQSIGQVMDESDSDKNKNTANQPSRSLRSNRQSPPPAMDKSDSSEIENVPKRQSRDLSKSKKLSVALVMDKSQLEVAPEDTNRQSMNLNRSRTQSTARVMDESDSEEIEDIARRPSRSLRSNRQSPPPAMDKSDSSEIENVPKRQSRDLSKSKKLSVAPVMDKSQLEVAPEDTNRQSMNLSMSRTQSTARVMDESDSEEIEDIARRPSRSLRSNRQSPPPAMDKSDSSEIENVPKRQSRNLSKSKKLSVAAVMDKSQLEVAPEDTNRQSKNLSRSRTQSTARVMNESDSEEIEDIAKRPRRSLRSNGQSPLPAIEESDSSEIENVPKRQSRNLSKSKKLSIAPVTHGSDLEGARNDTNRQSKKLDRSQTQSIARLMDESDSEEIEDIAKRPRRSLRSNGQSPLPAIEESDSSEIENVPKRQSRNLSKSKKLSIAPVTHGSDLEGARNDTNRQSKKLDRSQTQSIARLMDESDSEEIEDIAKRPRRSLRSNGQSALPAIEESDSSEMENVPKRQSRNLRKSKKLSIAPVMDKSDLEGARNDTNRQSKRLDRSQTQSTTRLMDESDSEEIQGIAERPSRSLRSNRQSPPSPMDESDSSEIENIPKRQSRDLSKSKKLSVAPVMDKSDLEVAPDDTNRQSKKLSRSQNKSTARVVDESDSEGNENTVNPLSRSLGSNQQPSPRAMNESDSGEVEDVPKRQNRNISKPKKLSMNDAERQSKKLRKSRNQSIARVTDESDSEEIENSATTPRVDINRSKQQQSILQHQDISRISRTNLDNLQKLASRDPHDFLSTTNDNRLENSENSRSRLQGLSVASVSYETVVEETDISGNRSRISNNSHTMLSPPQSAKETNPRTAVMKSSKGQQSIRDFFNATGSAPASQVLSDVEKLNEIKRELEKMKVQEMAAMKERAQAIKAKQNSRETNIIKPTRKTKLTESAKPVNKAYLLNGKVYKVPRLQRPKYWVTDRLYKYLWKRMEPTFDLETRVRSEKFVRQLSDVMSLIVKRKKYALYKSELHLLMKEMARLGIIHTRNDFYQFCQEFLPYELRIKTIPMMLPGNKSNIPFNPEKLNKPLLTP